MSLIGNLEDLSLPDILQIISLSKKSGVLIIRRREEEGRIYMRQGKVILAASARNRRNMGNILLEKGLVDGERLQRALDEQKRGGMKELLGVVLIRMGILDRTQLEGVVREQIEETVFYFLAWREGTFKFDLREVDPRLEMGIDPQVLISQSGVDTQWLVLEGTRLMDEKHRRGEALEKIEHQGPGVPTAGPRGLILVDDDDLFAEWASRAAAAIGVGVRRLTGVAEAREFMTAGRGSAGLPLVIDVVMPTSDGRGFLGGIELAKWVAAQYPGTRMKVITAYPDDSVLADADRLKLPAPILKPDLGGGDEESAMKAFLQGLLRDFAAKSEARAGATPGQVAPPARGPEEALREEMTVCVQRLETVLQKHPASRLLTDDLLQELERVQNAGEAGLIILRLASEMLERAILLKVVGREALGLGGFGFEAYIMKQRDGLRSLSVSLDDSPLIDRSSRGLELIRSTETAWPEKDLLGMIVGSPRPAVWALIPARGPGDSVLMLYGDNGALDKPIEEADVLSVFLSLAGLSMRKLALETGGPAASRSGGSGAGR